MKYLSALLALTLSWFPVAALTATNEPKPPVTLKLGGMLMYDALWYRSQGALRDSGTANYIHETGFRRTRLTAKGRAYNDWHYNLTLDFNDVLNGTTHRVAVWQTTLSYSGFKYVRLKAGQYFEPFSLESATSSKYITFLERGLPYTFSPSNSLGFGASTSPTDNLYLEAGLFQEDFDATNNLDRAYTGRIAYAPIHHERRLLHLGASASYRLPKNDSVRYRARPEINLAPSWFSSGTLRNVDNITLSNVEAAAVMGAWSLQAEYTRSIVDRRDNRPQRMLDGYYAYVSYFLSGESRTYRNGHFRAIKPKGSWGAWEVALRRSAIDDGNGETLRDITAGINWYLNRHARLMANYVRTEYDNRGEQGSANLYALRAQIDF